MDLSNFRKTNEDEEETWAEWLRGEESDAEPPKVSPRRDNVLDFKGASAKQPVQKPLGKKKRHGLKKSTSQEPAISIEIHMPHIHIPKPQIPWKRLRPWLITCGIILVLLVGGKWIQAELSQEKPVAKAPTVVSAELGYKALVRPATSDSVSNIPKPKYDKEKGIYTFNDIYQDARITVDQQAVPDKLRNNDEQIKKLEASVGTTESFSTTLGTVRVMTSKETGSQRLFIINDKMLMFIQSTKTLTNAQWVEYVQSLE